MMSWFTKLRRSLLGPSANEIAAIYQQTAETKARFMMEDAEEDRLFDEFVILHKYPHENHTLGNKWFDECTQYIRAHWTLKTPYPW